MSRLSDLFNPVSSIKKRKKRRSRRYDSEVLALKMEVVRRPAKPKEKVER